VSSLSTEHQGVALQLAMVGTRASTRLKAATKEELNYSESGSMAQKEHEVQPEEREEEEVSTVPSGQCRKCVPDPAKPSSPVSGYLVGFAKRVVICTLLVFTFKSVWPQLQSRFWPEPPVKEGKCYVLNDKSFRGHVSRGDHIVMMYAPWCGHCQRLKPIWDKIAKKPGVSGVKVAKVDCTASKATCEEHQVKGYPTILYFRNGKKIETYNGGKSEDELLEYLERMRSDSQTPSMEDLMPPPPPSQKPTKKKAKKKPSTEL